MEEDIEILEDLSFELKSFSLDIEGLKRAQAIENLINRVKELEEIEEEHRKENGKLQEKIKELVEDNRHQWEERCKMAIELDNDVIPKSKIKEKIELIKNLNEKIYYEENVISILQELLEE